MAEDPGTHPATAAIIWGLVAFFLALTPAAIIVLAVDRHPGLAGGLAVLAVQVVACATAAFWAARRHRGGTEW